MSSEGVRLESKRLEMVGSSERLRPLRDQIVVRPLPWTPSRTIQIAGDTQRTLRSGTVVATGPGVHPWRYNHNRSKRWLSKAFRPTAVKVGDVVHLGGPTQDSDWMFPTIIMDGALHIICRDEDVCLIVDCNCTAPIDPVTHIEYHALGCPGSKPQEQAHGRASAA